MELEMLCCTHQLVCSYRLAMTQNQHQNKHKKELSLRLELVSTRKTKNEWDFDN